MFTGILEGIIFGIHIPAVQLLYIVVFYIIPFNLIHIGVLHLHCTHVATLLYIPHNNIACKWILNLLSLSYNANQRSMTTHNTQNIAT